MPDFYTHIQGAQEQSVAEQKKTGQPVAGHMDEKYKKFCVDLESMIKTGEIDVNKPETCLNKDVYGKLTEEWKSKVDVALQNIVNLLRHIADFYISKETPNSSPQLQTMIDQLWEMKERTEKDYDVFKF